MFVAILIAVSQTTAQSSELRSAIKSAVEKEFPSLRTPGLSVAVAVSNQVCWSDGFGFADLERKLPAQRDTVYRYASISKPIAATAIMQWVERGKVSLDAPIQRYVPGFPEKPEGTITVRQLLIHTAGIRHYRGQEFLSNRRYRTVAEALLIFQADPLEFPPGAKYQYSSHGYNLLAAVVETASGRSYRAWLKEEIFRPAGMINTDLEFLEEALTNRCRQYVRNGEAFVPAPPVDLSCKWAGGGMAETAEDLVRFCIALDQDKLLRLDSRAVMYQPAGPPRGRLDGEGLGAVTGRYPPRSSGCAGAARRTPTTSVLWWPPRPAPRGRPPLQGSSSSTGNGRPIRSAVRTHPGGP